MNQPGSHLTDSQIERYVAESFGDCPAEHSEAIETHFADCDSCRARWLAAERAQLGVLKGRTAKTPYTGCPGEEVIAEYVAGLCSPEMNAKIRTHATRCNFCAPLLKQYIEDFSDDLPAEAKSVVAQLPALTPKWRRKFIRERIFRMGSFFSRIKNFLAHLGAAFFAGKLVLGGGLAAIVVASVVAGPQIVNRFKLNQTQQLAAAAVKQGRPSEMRLAWAPYGEFKLTRSKASEHNPMLGRSTFAAALSTADEKENSPDPRWIRLRGRVHLLMQDNEAIDLLAKARDSGLDDPGTQIDLAVAYFQRATSAGQNPPDVGNTIELLNQVLKNTNLTQQEKATALFDLAIAWEKVPMWDVAADIWKEYLKVDRDSNGSWYKEAQQNLDHALKQIPPPKQTGWREPSFFLSHVSSPEVQDSVEEYQDIALRKWLPEGLGNTNSTGLEAAHALAGLLEGPQHVDPWMKDFLAALQPDDQEALLALGAAVSNNRRGLHTKASEQARIASALLAQHGNYPGALRARFELVYANQRLWEEQRCVENAQKLEAELRNTQYRWLQAQIALEQAACLYREAEGKSDESQDQLQFAREAAEASHFPILTLRALTFAASIRDSTLKDADNCWSQMRMDLGQGLERYWRGPSFPGRLYEFYVLVQTCFRQKRHWYAAEAVQRRMITILENEIDQQDENVVLEVIAHQVLEHILKELRNDALAEVEGRRAVALLDKISDEAVTRKYGLFLKLDLADLQLEREETGAALAILDDIADLVETTQDDLTSLNFYRVRGDAWRKGGQLVEASRDYETGLEIAERALSHLKDEDKRRQWTSETGEIYRGLVAVFLEEKNDLEALQLWEWYQARSLAQKASAIDEAHGNSWAKIEPAILRQPVPDGSSTRLVYVTTRDHVYIWVIGKTGIKTVPLRANREELNRKIRQYLEKCSNPSSNSAALEGESRELFLLLLQPVIPDLRASNSIAIDLDPTLSSLALETLKSPEGWYFGQRYELIQSPGFIRENALRSPIRKTYDSGLILDSGDLPRSEHDDIAAFLPTIESLNSSGTAAEELPALLVGRDLFIFVGHGHSGALMVSDSTPLTPRDFPPKSLKNLRLAVLAACSTGVAESGLLDTNNLVHAFLAGGTSNVIASQWDVDSAATTDLMRIFFRQLTQGKSVTRSLFEARQEVFKSHSHPYYWGGFTVTGRAS